MSAKELPQALASSAALATRVDTARVRFKDSVAVGCDGGNAAAEGDPGEEQASKDQDRPVLPSETLKTTKSTRTSRSDVRAPASKSALPLVLSGVSQPNLGMTTFTGVLKRRLQHQKYTATYCKSQQNIHEQIYDNKQDEGRTRLLQQEDIITVDADVDDSDDQKEPDHGRLRYEVQLIRCFTDWKAKWAALALLSSVVVTCCLAPMTFVFGGTWTEHKLIPGGRTTLIIDLVNDLVYVSLLVLHLFTTFMHRTRRVEITCHRKVVWRWVTDPLYVFMMLSCTVYFWIIVCRCPTILNSMKAVRIAHLMVLPDALWLFQENFRVRISRMMVLLLGVSHWVGCWLSYLGGYREALLVPENDGKFALQFNGETLPHSGRLKLYLSAFVEALYMLTGALDNPLGDGGLREDNLGSLIMVSVFGPVGCVIVAMIVAAVVRETDLLFALDIRHEENKAWVTRALENLNVPEQLQRRVESLHYFQRMSHDHEAITHLFREGNLSTPLEDAIRVYLYHNVVKSPVLVNGGSNYILEVVRVLEDRMYVPGDYVARRGEVGNEMFFINRGELVVLLPGRSSNSVTAAEKLDKKLKIGSHFGEVGLLRRSLRTAWVRAETYVVASVLHRASIEAIWEFFPQEREKMVQKVTATCEKDKVRADGMKHVGTGAPVARFAALVAQQQQQQQQSQKEAQPSQQEENSCEGSPEQQSAVHPASPPCQSTRRSHLNSEEDVLFESPNSRLSLPSASPPQPRSEHRRLSRLETLTTSSIAIGITSRTSSISEGRLERLYEELAWGQEALTQRVEDLCGRHDVLNERVAKLLLFIEQVALFPDNRAAPGSGTAGAPVPASRRRVGDSWPAVHKSAAKTRPASAVSTPRPPTPTGPSSKLSSPRPQSPRGPGSSLNSPGTLAASLNYGTKSHAVAADRHLVPQQGGPTNMQRSLDALEEGRKRFQAQLECDMSKE